ncbi:hypothetical protein RQP46_009070 [Phenoliferia psychrophenolica]
MSTTAQADVFYEPGTTAHGLPHDPFKACVVPRPIGWISTLNPDGSANIAPYSQFNNLTFDPPYVKDTTVNTEREGEFCWSLAEQVPFGEDEFKLAGLSKEPGKVTRTPMVKESPVKFECKYHSTIRLPGNGPMGSVDIIIGKVVGIHIASWALTNGMIDIKKTQPIARCGYWQYAVIRDTFEMIIPGDPRIRAGLEGSTSLNASMKTGDFVEEAKDEKDMVSLGH